MKVARHLHALYIQVTLLAETTNRLVCWLFSCFHVWRCSHVLSTVIQINSYHELRDGAPVWRSFRRCPSPWQSASSVNSAWSEARCCWHPWLERPPCLDDSDWCRTHSNCRRPSPPPPDGRTRRTSPALQLAWLFQTTAWC